MEGRINRITVDTSAREGTVSPLLFGHNLEHTRRSLYRGLCAELLSGRKFTGTPLPPGVAQPWHAIGGRGCHFQVERGWGNWGMKGEPYTANFDPSVNPRRAGIYCQTVRSYRDGRRTGIGQGDIPLVEGRRYEGFAALRSEQRPEVELRVTSRNGEETYFRTILTPSAEGWGGHEFTFAAPASDRGARLDLTVDGPCAFSVGSVSLRPADNFHGMRTDVVELLERISAPILRWPGGNFAGCYRWRDGLLPVHRRAPLPAGGILVYTYQHDDHEIGTDEFVALCRKIGAEPWITINVSLEDAKDAAAWVEYCNGSADTEWGARRVERGFPEPYGIRYWSLGNEMGYGHMKGPNAPAEYGRCAAECAAAMKAVDPSIILVASGTWWREEWFPEVLTTYGQHFDYLSHHEYTAFIRDFGGQKGVEEVRRLASSPAGRSLEAIELLRSRIDDHAPAGKSIGISFDEWNVWHAWYGDPGVAEGLHTAAMLNMFCREARRLGMDIGAYFEPVNEGAIRVEPGEASLTPAGCVFALFRAHHGNDRVPVPPPGPKDALDAAASLDREKGELMVTVINRDPASRAEGLLVLEGEPAHTAFASPRASGEPSSARGTVLSAPDFLPGSDFVESEMKSIRVGREGIGFTLPACSVALLRVSFGGE